MPDVKNPPLLVAQETQSWCFAAAEVMVRNCFGLPNLSQYVIARRITENLAALDPEVQEKWELALMMDQSLDLQEDGGTNSSSHLVQLVRSQWNAFDHTSTSGYFVPDLTAELVRKEIDNNRVFVIGNAIHYYVVYGYSENGNVLHLRDPWPAGRGGSTTQMRLKELVSLKGSVTIFFHGTDTK